MKDGSVGFITVLRDINKRLVMKPFPLPEMSTIRQELEGLTHATTLELNMGTILLDDMSQVSTYPLSRYKPIIWSLSRTLEGN